MNDIPIADPATTKVLSRLHRLEGQIRGVGHMVESGVPCVDILTQLSAVIAATRETGLLVLEHHLSECVLQPGRSDEEMLGELTDAVRRFSRSVG